MSESQAMVPSNEISKSIEEVLIGGDLSRLSPQDRVSYYNAVCKSMGLNPLTQPFAYIKLNDKLILYARRDCTDQLRKVNHVNITGLVREKMDDVYVVTASAETQDGRRDESIGAVSIGGLRGEALANAFMKAETKAKRRVTLSIVGLGMLDETEIETVPSAMPSDVNTETGEMTQPVQIAPPKPAQHPSIPPQPARRAVSRQDLATRYQGLVDKADVVEVPAKTYDPSWSDQTLIDEGMALNNRIATKEAQLAQAG